MIYARASTCVLAFIQVTCPSRRLSTHVGFRCDEKHSLGGSPFIDTEGKNGCRAES